MLKRQVTLYQTSLFYLILSLQSLSNQHFSEWEISVTVIAKYAVLKSIPDKGVLRHSCELKARYSVYVCICQFAYAKGFFVKRFVAIYSVNKCKMYSIYRNVHVTVFFEFSTKSSLFSFRCNFIRMEFVRFVNFFV